MIVTFLSAVFDRYSFSNPWVQYHSLSCVYGASWHRDDDDKKCQYIVQPDFKPQHLQISISRDIKQNSAGWYTEYCRGPQRMQAAFCDLSVPQAVAILCSCHIFSLLSCFLLLRTWNAKMYFVKYNTLIMP